MLLKLVATGHCHQQEQVSMLIHGVRWKMTKMRPGECGGTRTVRALGH